MTTCKNCKFWDKDTNIVPQSVKEQNVVFGECKNKKFIYYKDNSAISKLKNNELIYWDAESYRAGFITGGNFGCVNHEL